MPRSDRRLLARSQLPFGWATLSDAESGYAVTVPKAPYQLSKSGAHIHSPPPRVGQHTDEILRRLGFGESDIKELRATCVVEAPPTANRNTGKG